MQAIVYASYGSPAVLRLAELPTPTPTDVETSQSHLCASRRYLPGGRHRLAWHPGKGADTSGV